MTVDTGQPPEGHRCARGAPALVIPAILVVPMKFKDTAGYWYWFDLFEPYWLTDVLVLHEDTAPPDPTHWRPGALSEIVPGVAEYPEMGSLRVSAERPAEVGWMQSTVQAYLQDGVVKVNCGGSPRDHHVAYVQRWQAPTPPRTRVAC
jgi:hypothetical protein